MVNFNEESEFSSIFDLKMTIISYYKENLIIFSYFLLIIVYLLVKIKEFLVKILIPH